MKQGTKTLIEKHTVEFRQIPITELLSDFSYQRATIAWKVKRIESAFDINAAGALLVSMRNNGKFYVVDGRHRLEAMRRLGMDKAWCQVLIDLSVTDEAALFLLCQVERTQMSAIAQYRCLIAAEDPGALYLESILRSEGFYATSGCSMDTSEFLNNHTYLLLGCVKALWHILYGDAAGFRGSNGIVKSANESLLRLVLKTIKMSWPCDNHGRTALMVTGLALWWKTYRAHPMVSLERVVNSLQRQPARTILLRAKSTHDATGKSHVIEVAREILAATNNGRRSQRLPDLF